MGRIVVITGGTSGIGLVLKNLFESNGDTVLTFSLEDTGSPNHYQGNVDHEIKVRQVFNDIYQRHGRIDILINGAGIGMSAITELADMEEIKRVMDVNYYGTLYSTRSALPFMGHGAKIVNMSSAMALFPVPFRSIYASAKSAILNLSFSLRMELAPLGIDVIAMCPGNAKTNFTKNRIKNFETNARYGDRLENATLSSDANEEKRMSAQEVGETIYNLINKPKSKPFYIIGKKYKFLYFLTRITPKSLLINMTAKFMGGNKPPKKGGKQNKPTVIQETPEQRYSEPIQQTPVQQPIFEEPIQPVQQDTQFQEDIQNIAAPTQETQPVQDYTIEPETVSTPVTENPIPEIVNSENNVVENEPVVIEPTIEEPVAPVVHEPIEQPTENVPETEQQISEPIESVVESINNEQQEMASEVENIVPEPVAEEQVEPATETIVQEEPVTEFVTEEPVQQESPVEEPTVVETPIETTETTIQEVNNNIDPNNVVTEEPVAVPEEPVRPHVVFDDEEPEDTQPEMNTKMVEDTGVTEVAQVKEQPVQENTPSQQPASTVQNETMPEQMFGTNLRVPMDSTDEPEENPNIQPENTQQTQTPNQSTQLNSNFNSLLNKMAMFNKPNDNNQ